MTNISNKVLTIVIQIGVLIKVGKKNTIGYVFMIYKAHVS